MFLIGLRLRNEEKQFLNYNALSDAIVSLRSMTAEKPETLVQAVSP
jgi:hypothetical protein